MTDTTKPAFYGTAVYGESTYGGDAPVTPSQYVTPPASTHLPYHWINRLLSLLMITVNHQNTRLMTAWQRAEGGTAAWNPLNTTLALGGSVNWVDSEYNSIGVKNYKYDVAGVCATALTFSQRDSSGKMVYGSILSDMKSGNYTAEQIIARNSKVIELWGTSPTLMVSILKGIK